MTYSIIKKSQLEGANRLDAEYYQPEYFIDFSKGKWILLGDQINCQYGLSLAMNDNKIGFPMFKMDDIKYSFLLDDEVRYANVSDYDFNNYRLKQNDVLFNRVNSEEFVGRTGIFKSNLDSVFASYLIRLKVRNNAEILPDYLNIFLNSKFGLKQIRKFARRAVNQANVNAEELKQFKIAVLPFRFQKEIEDISNKAWGNFQDSKNLYKQAENLLLEELELRNIKFEDDLSFIVNFSDVKTAHRADAEYFQPKYEILLEKIKNKNLKSLTEYVENVDANFNPYLEPNKTFSYIELANINSSLGIIDSSEKVLGKKTPSRAKRLLKENDVIVSSVEGSLEKVAITRNENEGSLASTGFFQFRSKKILPEYLLILAKSMVLQWQLKKYCAGTILTAVPSEALKKMFIPILSHPTQKKIAELVRKSHSSRQKVKELLDQAKRKVEEMIEKGK